MRRGRKGCVAVRRDGSACGSRARRLEERIVMTRVTTGLLLAFLLLAGASEAQKRSRKPCMRWESNVLLGVEEARLRNVPIVLHLLSDT